MAWITPKTDWTANTFINSADVNRWIGNLNYLRELASHLYTSRIQALSVQEKEPIVEWRSYLDEDIYLYADEMNDIERCLTDINNGTLNYEVGKQQTYRDNGAMPDYNELNRIESAMLRLYTEMTIQHNNLDRLAFTLGGERKFKI